VISGHGAHDVRQHAVDAEQVRGGKLKGLGVTSAERSKAAPDIPTIAEDHAGLRRHSVVRRRSPAGHARADRRQLEAAIGEMLASPTSSGAGEDDLGLDLPPGRAASGIRGLWPTARHGSRPSRLSGVKLD
jgi:hypothetical protein